MHPAFVLYPSYEMFIKISFKKQITFLIKNVASSLSEPHGEGEGEGEGLNLVYCMSLLCEGLKLKTASEI